MKQARKSGDASFSGMLLETNSRPRSRPDREALNRTSTCPGPGRSEARSRVVASRVRGGVSKRLMLEAVVVRWAGSCGILLS